MTSQCPRCATPRLGDYPICQRCGLDFRYVGAPAMPPQQQAAPSTCQRCHAPLYPGYTQCGNCGYDSRAARQPEPGPVVVLGGLSVTGSTPQAYSQPPATPPQGYSQPQAYSQPPATPPQGYGQPSGYQGFGYAPIVASRNWTTIFVALGAIGLVVVIIAGAFMMTAGGGSHLSPAGSLSIVPSTYTCTGETHTITIQLPASVPATDEITIKEGTVQGAGVFDTKSVQEWGFTQQSGGSWYLSDTGSLGDLLAYGYVCAFFIPGSYTMYVFDSGGSVLAQASYTVQ